MQEYTPENFDLPPIEGISQETIDVHLGLYKGYVTNLNAHCVAIAQLQEKDPENTMMISALTRRITFELAGVQNHKVYFGNLVGGPTPCPTDSSLHKHIQKQFGSMEDFQKHIRDEALSMRGVGWVLVLFDKEVSRFHIVWTSDHELGNVNLPSIVALDMWEHSYMIDYRPAEKSKYVDAYLNAINWQLVSGRFDRV